MEKIIFDSNISLEEYHRILNLSRRRAQRIETETKRFLSYKIDWRDRLIAITGSRGTGKTTLILQHMKDCFPFDSNEALYVSMDNLWFETHSLWDLAEVHVRSGGTHLFIDEIHYLNNWQQVIKNLYDEFPELHIVYTGSSLLKIDYNSGDLSRRQITYTLPGLSFREYLYFENALEIQPITLQELLKNHVRISGEITGKIKVFKYFPEYLAHGYYPFYKEVYAGYEDRLLQIINQVLESDYPAVEPINFTSVQKIKKMLYVLAQSCPQTPNMSDLYRQLETDRNQGLKMLSILEKANLLNILSSQKSSLKNLSRPEKIYCNNTNLMHALSETINTGTKRETFFLNQLRSAGFDVFYPEQGDFLVEGKYLFEVGGKGKSFHQIKDIPDSFLAVDDEETGRGNRIPLWMFGLLY